MIRLGSALGATAVAAVALALGWQLAGGAGGRPGPDAAGAGAGPGPPSAAPRARARALARRWLLVDTHIDLPYRLVGGGEEPTSLAGRTAKGDFDAVRAREGGLDVAWMSIYIPASYQTEGGARALADELIDLVEGIAAAHPDIFEVARGAEQAVEISRSGRIALPLGMENGAGIEDDLANLRHFRERGIGYITLTHSEDNLISDSSYSDPDTRRWHGISPFGREVVAEMNRLGILVDVSHVSDEAFDAVIEATLAPPIASHSSCRHFTPGFERNLDDERIRRLAEAGGVIQINFGSGFLTAAANAWSAEARPAAEAFVEEHGVGFDSPEFKAWMADYLAAKPLPRATLDDVVAHIEHVIEVAGVDHVGFGSDFDGVGPTLPEELADVSMYPNLIARLLERGHSEADVEKIAGGNLLRVWREAERVALALEAKAAD
ncbi:MAG TPA: dipeptidase [Thermoanaerobaculia bacterium]|nr:dipeptidase [Thermoanaerobaculia bacterium]